MPLAHILAPQIARKAQEIEAELGHAPTGYLDQSGNVANPTGTRSPSAPPLRADVKEPAMDNPGYNTAVKHARYLQQSPADRKGAAFARARDEEIRNKPSAQIFREAAIAAAQRQDQIDKIKPLPNAPVAAAPEKQKLKKKDQIIPRSAYYNGKLTGGEPFGYAEDGQAIDSNGKKLGYLTKPALVTPYGDQPLSAPVYGMKDAAKIPMHTRRFSPNDPASQQYLEELYGPHLKAMEDNRDANGMPTDEFPAGYFKGMSKDEKANIEFGVEQLKLARRPVDV